MRTARGLGRRGVDEAEAELKQALVLLSLVAGDSAGLTVLAVKAAGKGFSTRAYDRDQLDTAARDALQLSDDGNDVYVHMCLAQTAPAWGRRLSAADAWAMHTVWAELDYGSEGHRNGAAPPDRQSALEIIEAFPLQPSLVVGSGNGFHLYWARSEGGVLQDEEARRSAAALADGFGKGWQAHVESYGFKADSVFDLSRVLRVPGTTNHKDPSNPKAVRVVSTSGLRYTDADMRAVSRSGKTARSHALTARAEPARGGDLDRILAGCAFMRHVRDDAATLPEPEWMIAATVANHCRDGRAAFHDLSRPYPRYSAGETDAKFDHASEYEPYGCARIYDEHFDGCRECAFLGSHGSPADLGAPPPEGTTVRLTGSLQDAAAAAWRGVYTGQAEPTLFRQGSTTIRAYEGPGGGFRTALCARDDFRYVLVRSATFLQPKRGSLVEVPPDDSLLRDMMATPYPPLPPLRGLAETPVLREDGTLAIGTGYDVPTGFLISVPPSVRISEVPQAPSTRQLQHARRLLLDELLGDFDFVGDADRAHALAALLRPFGRALTPVPEIAPLHLISKPTQGSGGSLLAKALMLPAYGSEVAVLTEAEKDAEWRKRITAMAVANRSVVLIDNIKEPLDSPALAAALTSARWSDRLLGASTMVDVEFAPLWLVTGNNPTMSSEISRRTVQIRIDPGVDRPWMRDGFQHPNLIDWATRNRGRLIRAALVLWRHWFAEGWPEFQGQPLGSYEAWSRTLGGVLETADIPGFLENLNDLYEASDDAGKAERALLVAWAEHLGERPVTSRQVVSTLLDDVALDIPWVLEGRDERARATEMGKKLRAMVDRRYDVVVDGQPSTLRVVQARMQAGTNRWKVVAD